MSESPLIVTSLALNCLKIFSAFRLADKPLVWETRAGLVSFLLAPSVTFQPHAWPHAKPMVKQTFRGHFVVVSGGVSVTIR